MHKKHLSIVLLLIFSIFIVEPPPMAIADGSVDAQDIWLQCNDNDYPDQWTGVDNGEECFENYIRGSVVNHTDLWGYQSDWDFNITSIRFYTNGGTGTTEGKAGIYEYVAYNDAGELFGVSQEIQVSQYEVWTTFPLDNPISLPPGSDPQYWGLIWGENEVGDFNVNYDSNPTSDGEALGLSLDYTGASGNYPDPMTGESVVRTIDYWVRGYVTAFTTNQTGFNQYYDLPTNITVTRRDIDITIPTGTSNREIKVTLPKSEKLLNLTYYNGGEWNESLSGSDYTFDSNYNATHMLITIPEATIASYGEDYRIYSETYAYIFTMRGLFSENGTLDGSVNVTAHSLSSSTEHEVNGELALYYDDDKPIQFSWGLSGGGSRRIYTYEGSYDIYIFTPDDDYASYSFTIRDYTGTIGSGDTYLEALRLVNGTERVIERVLIWDTVNAVPLTLTQSQIYVLQVRMPDDSIYRFGYFVPGGDATPILTLKEISFSQKAQLTGKYVTVEATRPTDTHIKVNYNDTLEQTESVFVEICYRNGTQAWNDTSSADSFQFNWLSANNETDYVVTVEIEHEFFGTLKYSQALSGAKGSHSTAPDLSLFGDWGPIDGSSVFSIILILIVAGAFSRVSGPVGLFCSIMTAGGLTYAEWINIDYKIIAAALALNALYAYAEAK